MKQLISFVIFILVWEEGARLCGQESVIFGVVTDVMSGEPLPSVNIEVKEEPFGTTTNENGYYVISLTKDTSTLIFSHIGYVSIEIAVFTEQRTSFRLNVTLSPTSLQGDTVTVTSSRITAYDHINISTIRLQSRTLQSIPQLVGEADLLRTLQSLPGVITLNEFRGGLYVRGGRTGQNLVLIDGAQLYHITHLYGIYSVFNMDAVKQVDLIKGGFPARYGSRVSSVLNIINKEGNRNEFKGDLHLGLVSSKASLQGPIVKGSWFLAGRRTYYDYVIGDRTSLPEYYFYDLNGKLTQQITPRDKLTLSLYQGNDTFVDDYRSLWKMEERTQRWGNQLVSVRWVHQFNERLWGNFMVAYSQYHARQQNTFQDYDNGEIVRRRDFYEATALFDYNAKASLQYYYNKAHTEYFGIELKRFQFDYTNSSSYYSDSFSVQIPFQAVQLDGYWQDNWQITSQVQVQSGLRFSNFSLSSRLQLSPRLATQYRFTDKTTLKVAWGQYVQYINQMNVVEYSDNAQVSGEDMPLFGNFGFFLPAHQSIPPTEAYHYIIGIESFLKHGIQLTLESYYKQIYQIPDWQAETGKINSIYQRVMSLQDSSLSSFIESGNGQAYGFELLIRKYSDPIRGWLSYTWSRTLLQYDYINEGKVYPAMYDRTHDFAIMAQYDLGRKWSISLAWFYATGQPYTPYKHPKNSKRLKPYHRLDISFFRIYRFRHWQLKAYLQIFNAYNQKNVWGKTIKIGKDNEVKAEHEIRTLPIIPSIGIQASF